MQSKILEWFDDRWPFKAFIRYSLEEEIPGGDSFWYCFGAVTLFVFVIQVVTGIWQLFFYVPTVDHAYQSVMYLRQEVPFGWFIHGLHYWGSNAFIIIVVVHMLRVFIWGAYKYPRQLTWCVGVLLFFLVMALSFTGALLPWDELGYWAAEVGTSIAGTVPVIGFFIKEFMRGQAGMSQATLSRFFIVHVAILPGILAALIAFHIVAFRQFRSVGPWDLEKRKKTGFFWPNQILKDLIIVSGLFIVLVALIAFWRAPVTGPADAIDNIIMPKPEWQFLFLYQFLKLFKGRMEPVGTVGVPLVLFLILFLLPFYDRNRSRNPLKRPLAMLGCFALLVWFGVYTVLGYYSKPGANLIAKISVSPGSSASVKAGAQLFSSQGCVACHTVHGQGGHIGPNLSNIGAQGLSNKWLTQQIRDPKSHDPSTEMPAFKSLTDKQVSNLVDFLQSLGGQPSSSKQSSQSSGSSTQAAQSTMPSKTTAEPNSTSKKTSTEPNKSSATAEEQKQASQPVSLVQQGESLFSSESCIGCHTVDGKGGKVGPNLSDIGNEGKSDKWLTVQIKDPKSHDPDTIMPSFSSLSAQKIEALVAYLHSLKKNSGGKSESNSASEDDPHNFDGAGQNLKPGPAAYLVGNPPHGKKLYNKWCSQCHGKDGKGGVANPGSQSGKIPSLNPISESLYSSNPVTFAENIDRIIQHGSKPPGPNPEKTMPAFGDDLKLTQQMIAEIEAYILKLNNVDRAAIVYPGVRPYVFFAITIIVYAVAVFIIIYMWFRNKGPEVEPSGVPSEQSRKPEADSTERQAQSEGEKSVDKSEEDKKEAETMDKQSESQRNQERRLNSIVFTVIVIILIVIIATGVLMIFSSFVTTKPVPSIATLKITSAQSGTSQQEELSSEALKFNPPAPNEAPVNIRSNVERGEAILRHTHTTLPKHTGNALDCTNCHFVAGMTKNGLSLVGVWSVYPKYDEQTKRPIDLTMKTNACFERYLNTEPLPADSNDMLDILTYYRWISKGIPVDANVPWLGLQPIKSEHKPDIQKGEKIFSLCMPCHGQKGQGLLPSGAPPLWGEGAFPSGGGMGRVDMLSAFVHRLMPKNNPDLSVNEALDVAGFVLSHPRPQQKQKEQE
jgi:ubiquinol-cytochrome c reductase cytochrome b subunit